jgi:signal recognition particle subunit SEC65
VWKDESGNIRFYNHMAEGILEDLEISCQWNLFEDGDLKSPYAWRVAYDWKMEMNHLDFAKEKMTFLSKISAKLDKLRQEFGSADDFETYVVRIASAMGIKVFIVNHYNNPEEYSAHEIKAKIKAIYTK